jgi:hypothetical protein
MGRIESTGAEDRVEKGSRVPTVDLVLVVGS